LLGQAANFSNARGHTLNTLSVLLPVYNAQGKLAAGVADVLEVLSQWSTPFELCILDDGSSDDTADEARELAARFPQVRLIRHPVQLGLGEAIQTGLDHTDGELVLVSSEDYELDPDDLRTLWRLRDAQCRHVSHDTSADPRLAKLLAWKPGSSDGRGGFDVIPREAFEQFRLSQAVDMVRRVDSPRTNPGTVVARRRGEPKYLKIAGQFAGEP
jgi:glycosyltransferase involved in cell wall biosynthesis